MSGTKKKERANGKSCRKATLLMRLSKKEKERTLFQEFSSDNSIAAFAGRPRLFAPALHFSCPKRREKGLGRSRASLSCATRGSEAQREFLAVEKQSCLNNSRGKVSAPTADPQGQVPLLLPSLGREQSIMVRARVPRTKAF